MDLNANVPTPALPPVKVTGEVPLRAHAKAAVVVVELMIPTLMITQITSQIVTKKEYLAYTWTMRNIVATTKVMVMTIQMGMRSKITLRPPWGEVTGQRKPAGRGKQGQKISKPQRCTKTVSDESIWGPFRIFIFARSTGESDIQLTLSRKQMKHSERRRQAHYRGWATLLSGRQHPHLANRVQSMRSVLKPNFVLIITIASPQIISIQGEWEVGHSISYSMVHRTLENNLNWRLSQVQMAQNYLRTWSIPSLMNQWER